MSHLIGTIHGPPGTPYEGGKFDIDFRVPDNYPFSPPKARFVTPVYHPNVSSKTGAICLDVLTSEWSPVLNLKTTLLSIQQLLESPEPDDPQDAVVAAQYRSHRDEFERTAKQWTKVFAMAASTANNDQGDDEEAMDFEAMGVDPVKVAQLSEMGYPSGSAVRALRHCGGDVVAAAEKLMMEAS
ncbi:ubiquitin conjugating enzyme [Catenaria anguillulae PL171]|uniref:Ubiquitin conjugating enzyme n=1 Tax=Catenaria anguillulae PL171 TaxID=765915 RepID=A0A1Y2HG05_9FUNG|nr:ubiquitin conjugating enzyme [Catenaria anguillulae PL171]